MELFEDILQRGRRLHRRPYGETEAMSLTRTVIGVLAQYQHLHVLIGREVQRCEDILMRGKDLVL